MKGRGHRASAVLLALWLGLGGCYALRASNGGAEATFEGERKVDADDVAVPSGYRIEIVATGLTFPTGVTFDEQGTPYVVESGYAYGEVWTTPRLLRVTPDGISDVATGGRNGPWTGVTYRDGAFFVAEGGELEGGRILRIERNGAVRPLLEHLPSVGDHHTNGPVIGPDGALYFGQGTATNSAVVGEDSAKFGWLARHPEFHDIPGEDVELTGCNFTSDDPLRGGSAVTGAFLPFGTASRPGQVIPGRVPCTGAVMKLPLTGGPPTLVAWGFRNPFGLAFAPDGHLFVTDNGYDERGSRPVWGTADVLWRVEPGLWYGWPDFSAGRPLHDAEPVLARHPPLAKPVAEFAVHSSADGLDFSRQAAFGHVGDAFVALFGDETPATGKLLNPAGFRVVRVNPASGVIDDFAVNRGDTNGPASWMGTHGLERPVAVRFNPAGDALYVVDFGVMTHTAEGAQPRPSTGVLWRITRDGAP